MKKDRAARLLGLTGQVASVSERETPADANDGKMRTGMGASTVHARLEAKVDALQLALKQAQESNAAVFISLDAIDANPWQPRKLFKTEPLKALCDSIQATGVLQPIAVRTHPSVAGRYELIAGERRTRASRMVELKTIPAVVLKMTDAEMAAQALAENMVREDLTDYEVGMALDRMQSEFPNKVALAESFGISRTHLYRFLSFAKLPTNLLAILDKEPWLISAITADDLKSYIQTNNIQSDDPELGKAIEELVNCTLSSANLIERINKLKSSSIRAPESLRVKQTVMFEGKKIGVISKDASKFSFSVKASMLSAEQENQIALLLQKYFKVV